MRLFRYIGFLYTYYSTIYGSFQWPDPDTESSEERETTGRTPNESYTKPPFTEPDEVKRNSKALLVFTRYGDTSQ